MSKILVAEDNLPNRELIREILENSGYEVIEADDGQQALDKLATTEADLVLLDIQMPKHANLRVLAITAYAMQADREKVLQAGFDGYLTKPIDMAGLIKEIQQLLS